MTQEELNKVLENHKHWLSEDCEGWENMRAYLTGADLRGAYLTGVDLTRADLTGADLTGVDLRGAYLTGADLTGVDLRGAYLTGVDLTRADLTRADLRGARNVPFIPYSCPEVGMFIGYKKARGYIVELDIPEDAKRLSATSRKCRCNKAKVLRILNFDKTVADVTEVRSKYDHYFIYRVGEVVTVDNFDEDRWNECSTGIHFFINFQEAVNY